jgi:tRNA(fMet)-specific endonuclease VapC
MKYSLDTCTLLFWFYKNDVTRKKLAEYEKVSQILIPPIAYHETLRGLLDRGATAKIATLKAMYQNSCTLVQIYETKMLEKAAEIYVNLKRKHFTVGDNDIYIAAWSILANATLVTDNTKDFENIDGLLLENWRH